MNYFCDSFADELQSSFFMSVNNEVLDSKINLQSMRALKEIGYEHRWSSWKIFRVKEGKV